MSTTTQKRTYVTPFWQHVKFVKNHHIQGLIAGRPYLYNSKTGDVYRHAGGWVLMTEAELAAKPYIKDTLSVEYSKFDSQDDRWNKLERRKQYSLAATRACNSRSF